jgi:serine protease
VLRAWTLAVTLLLVLTLPAGAAWGAGPRADQWGLERIGAPAAWETARGERTVVAVVDTGVHLTHPDLAPRLLRDRAGGVVGLDLVDGGAPHDEHGHGTLVAGVVGAAADAGVGGPGITGVAPDVRLMPVRVLDGDGRGRVSDIATGIRWAVEHGADVVNLSLESMAPLPGDVLGSGLDEAVREAWDQGVVVVAAAGNSGTPFTDFRSSTPVLLVGATDRDDRRAAFSDGGRSDMVMAPGVDIVSTACAPCRRGGGAGYATADGTSFAAPHVAGAVAVLRSAGDDHEEAVDRLRRTAVRVPGGALVATGHGRIDLAAAVGGPSAPRPRVTEKAASPRPEPSESGSEGRTAPSEPAPTSTSAGAEEPPGGGSTEPPPAPPPPEPPPPGAPVEEEEPDAAAAEAEEADDALAVTVAPPGDADLGTVELDAPPPRRVGPLEAVAAGLVVLTGAAIVGAGRQLDPDH